MCGALKEPSTADRANTSILKHPIRCSGRLHNHPRVVHLLLESATYFEGQIKQLSDFALFQQF
jgi:hypothetical protein